MNPIQAAASVFRNYANFGGRARRSEFWWFFLFTVVFQPVLGFLPLSQLFQWIFWLALLTPYFAVTVRRLHDTNRSARWLLLILPATVIWMAYLAIFMALSVIKVVNSVSPDLITGDPIGAGPFGPLVFILMGAGGILLAIVSFLLAIPLIVVLIQAGTNGPNSYGPKP